MVYPRKKKIALTSYGIFVANFASSPPSTLRLRLQRKQSVFSTTSLLLKLFGSVRLSISLQVPETIKSIVTLEAFQKKNNLPTTIHLDSAEATTPKEKADLFNFYFHSIFTSSSFVPPESMNSSKPPHIVQHQSRA